MKYRHLAQMPTDVKDWLEQQLEAYGIDAVVYTRYILSLLQQETLDDPYEYLPQITPFKKEKKRGRKQGGLASVNLHALDLDTLKRLAVVQCLMSATDETCDVEKLVDDLCAKLKDIKGQGVSTVDILPTDKQPDLSLLDPAAKYYAAFPPLVTDSEISSSPRFGSTCVWNRYIFVDSNWKNIEPAVEDKMLVKDNWQKGNDFGFEFTRGMDKCSERQEGLINDNINNFNEDEKETKRLYERNASDEENEKDEHLKGLISKFDHNIEALWNCDNDTVGYIQQITPPRNMYLNFDFSYIQYGTNIESSIWSSEDNANKWNNFSTVTTNTKKWSDHDNVHNTPCKSLLLDSAADDTVATAAANAVIEDNCPVEEEDLLTSAKTHFRPIKSEEGKISKPSIYADGTTFVIPNDWERVPFKRSESGTLYLESDAELEAPKVYMEFKDGRPDSSSNSECVSVTDEFIPKFCVRQSNEKFCQTEDIEEDEQVVPNDAVEYVANMNRKIVSDPDDFFFPGDDELAEGLDDEEDITDEPIIRSDLNCNEIKDDSVVRSEKEGCLCKTGWNDDWSKIGQTNTWETGKKPWQQIWTNSPQHDGVCKTCSTCQSCSSHAASLITKDKQYCQLRDELSEDGEQLMSDLSCFQQHYLFDEDGDNTSVSNSIDFDEGPNLKYLNLNEDNDMDVCNKDLHSFSKVLLTNKIVGEAERPRNKIWKTNIVNQQDNFNTSKEMDDLCEMKVFNIDSKMKEKILSSGQKDRKRRHSSSQRACKLYVEEQSFMPCWEQKQNQPHPIAAMLRPLTL